jgi:hypothetical protein
MLKTVLVRRTLPVLVALATAAAALVAGGRATSVASGPERLPDLLQETPTDLAITRADAGRGPYVLGFRSAVSNIGEGPLIIDGHRPGPEVGTMVADQVVVRDGAPQDVIQGVGELRYVVSPDHRHWHLLGFDRYELRRAGRRTAVTGDRKTGFCLGDRYGVTSAVPASPPPSTPAYTSRCGLEEPQLLGLREGISVGYGDDYSANLEGQYLRISGLRAGRYLLVHRANADRRLLESSYGNNAASLLLRLRWRRGAPRIRVLAVSPDAPRCAVKR